MDISGKLKKLRKERELTQFQLAKKAGVSQAFISDLEAKKKSPTLEVLEKICLSLGVSIIEFLSEVTNQYPEHLIPVIKEMRYLDPEQCKILTELLISFRKRGY